MPTGAGGVGEQRGESLHRPVDGDVVDRDAALGQQLLDIAIRQAVPQVSADGDRDHLRREPGPGKRRPADEGTSG
jgi:hypothetical protein